MCEFTWAFVKIISALSALLAIVVVAALIYYEYLVRQMKP
jgi:hypothetical protein